MAYRVNCPKCEVLLEVVEYPGIGPGGKDREFAYCPVCHTDVASEVTEGFISAVLVKEWRKS